MTHSHVNAVVSHDKSVEVEMLQQEVLRLQRLLEANGICHSGGVITNNRVFTPNNENFIDDVNPSRNYELHETTSKRSLNEIERQNLQNKSGYDEVRNCADTCLERMTCKKIIDALSVVLLNVDLFLKTVQRYPKSKSKESQETRELLSFAKQNEHSDDIVKADVPSAMKPTRQYKYCDNIEIQTKKIIDTTSCPSFKSNSLSSLLQKRRELNGVQLDHNKEDLKLKEELKKARKCKDQKMQIKRWLIEKEEKAENTLAAYSLDERC